MTDQETNQSETVVKVSEVDLSEVQQRLFMYSDKILGWAEEATSKGSSFVSEQTPILIQEVINYYTFYYGFWVFLSLILFLIALSGAIYVWRSSLDWDYIDGDGDALPSRKSVVFIASVIIEIVSAIMFFNTFFVFLKIIISPRLFLIEKLADIIKDIN